MSCCSTDFAGTKRMCGRLTASRIAERGAERGARSGLAHAPNSEIRSKPPIPRHTAVGSQKKRRLGFDEVFCVGLLARRHPHRGLKELLGNIQTDRFDAHGCPSQDCDEAYRFSQEPEWVHSISSHAEGMALRAVPLCEALTRADGSLFSA